MVKRTLAALVLVWAQARQAQALSLREVAQIEPIQARRGRTDAEEEIPPTNQAEHMRPEQRRIYKKRVDHQEDEIEQHAKSYREIGEHLHGIRNLSHSREILQFVMSHPEAPTLAERGCLYLPNNAAWASFYRHIEHPYPPLFTEMIANSFYPDCNATALTGVGLPSSCGANRMLGSRGCFEVSQQGRRAGIEIYETQGHIGLPDKWSQHILKGPPHRHAQRTNDTTAGYPLPCGMSDGLPAVPSGKRLEIPTVYVICRVSDDDHRITEKMVYEQNRWANEAYKGGTPWMRMDFDNGRPESVDMQLKFKVKEIKMVTDPVCARNGFTNLRSVEKYNTQPLEHFTIVVITDDQSGVLGQSEFPQDAAEDSQSQIVTVSAVGFRNFAKKHGGDMAYDEGDTVVHEVGHGLGLFHTFEATCDSATGDWVDDTAPEALPHYSCRSTSSCENPDKPDPVHNFMDYSPDTCMVGFTEGQKRRAWCVFEKYRPTLFKSSLTNE